MWWTSEYKVISILVWIHQVCNSINIKRFFFQNQKITFDSFVLSVRVLPQKWLGSTWKLDQASHFRGSTLTKSTKLKSKWSFGFERRISLYLSHFYMFTKLYHFWWACEIRFLLFFIIMRTQKSNFHKFIVGLSSTCNYVDMSSTWEKPCRCRHTKYFMTCDDMFIPKWYSRYPKNNKIMSNFSRDTTVVTLCQSSFILRLQCALYFRVCSISWPLVLWILMNQSCQSSHPDVGMVSLLYTIVLRSNRLYLYKVSSSIMTA